MDIQVGALGALLGLLLSIILIFKDVKPFYALFIGALVGGLLGGASLVETVQLMTEGSMGMITAILRILAAGILAGVLIKSGAAESIAYSIVGFLGQSKAMLALVLSAAILTFVGVFIDIAVITVAPIAIEVAKKAGFSRTSVLVAMIGGGKAGNIISPNPNTIAVSDAFEVPLTNVMLAGAIPAVFGVIAAYFIANRLIEKGTFFTDEPEAVITAGGEIELEKDSNFPALWKALIGPIVAISLLALRPLAGIEIDPMIALPVGGIVGALVMGKGKNLIEYSNFGLGEMTDVAIILLGTGLIAGIISNSTLGNVVVNAVDSLGLPVYLLAPIAGILMSGATASTTSGSAVASAVFSDTIIASGVAPLNGAAMIHAGATVLDHLPHGSFFHATAGSVQMGFKERLSIIGYETIIGLVLTIVSVIVFGLIL
jgi:GntP family gluconate:H+ symporter